MQIKNKLILSIMISSILFSTYTFAETKKEFEIKEEAEKAIRTVAGQVQLALYHKTKEGGSSKAATFCSKNAMPLAKAASKNLPKGIKVRRITNKPRNIKNKATPEQMKVLEEIESKLNNGEKIDMIVKQKSENHYQVYKPIKIMSKCLNCHGTDKTRDKEAYKIISKEYPNDKAMDYNLYDFRGAFLIDIIKNQ